MYAVCRHNSLLSPIVSLYLPKPWLAAHGSTQRLLRHTHSEGNPFFWQEIFGTSGGEPPAVLPPQDLENLRKAAAHTLLLAAADGRLEEVWGGGLGLGLL